MAYVSVLWAHVSLGFQDNNVNLLKSSYTIETGEELASVLTRDAARCIYFEKEYIYAFLNKRVLKLDRNNVCD